MWSLQRIMTIIFDLKCKSMAFTKFKAHDASTIAFDFYVENKNKKGNRLISISKK